MKLRKFPNKPTIIEEIKTVIGLGASKQGTASVHGAPLGSDIVNLRKNLNWEI